MNIKNEDVQYLLEHQLEIEEKIGYEFGNRRKLLIQAFTRKSFATENEGYQDNEVLEFYGDQLVNTIMTMELYDKYLLPPSYQDDFFYSKKNQAELSQIRAEYINRSTLAHSINILGLEKFLLLGKSDKHNEVWKNEKVCCDLFESIIGAIAVASIWNFKQIWQSCRSMWSVDDFTENHIKKLEDKCIELGISVPIFEIYFEPKPYPDIPYKCYWAFSFNNRSYKSILPIHAETQIAAKMGAASYILNFLKVLQIKDIVQKATSYTAIQTLNTLHLKNFISKPKFNYSVYSDQTGKQIWKNECSIDGYKYLSFGEADTKAEAKQIAAYDMLQFILKDSMNSLC